MLVDHFGDDPPHLSSTSSFEQG